VLEALICAGALDGLGAHRASLMTTLATALQLAGQHMKNTEAGQEDLFGVTDEAAVTQEFAEVGEWKPEQRLEKEKETLGLYLTGHPIERYVPELTRITDCSLVELKPTHDRTVTVAGLVVGMRTMQTRRGDRMAFITLDDRTGRLELAVFADLFAQHRELLVKDTLLVVKGQVSVDEYTGGFKMSADELYSIDQARSTFAKAVVISVDANRAANGFIAALKEVLGPVSHGVCPVRVHYSNPQAEADIVLGDEWKINPTEPVLERLSAIAGEGHVVVDYH